MMIVRCKGSLPPPTKKELSNGVTSGSHLRDVNTKLQYCKDYLEEQLDVLIKELKSSKLGSEKLKIEYANINAEKMNCAKQIIYIF